MEQQKTAWIFPSMSFGSRPEVGSPNWSISLTGISMKSLGRVKWRFPIQEETIPTVFQDPPCRSIPVWFLVHLAEEDRYNSPTQWRLVWGISSLSALTAKLTPSVYFGIMNCQLGLIPAVLWRAQIQPIVSADVTTLPALPLWQHRMQMPPLLPDFPSWLCRSWHTLWRQSQFYVWSSYLLSFGITFKRYFWKLPASIKKKSMHATQELVHAQTWVFQQTKISTTPSKIIWCKGPSIHAQSPNQQPPNYCYKDKMAQWLLYNQICTGPPLKMDNPLWLRLTLTALS